MFKFKSIVASFLMAMFLVSGCNPTQTQVNTAKDVMAKVTLTITFAEAYITAVEASYADNVGIVQALTVTKSALEAVRAALVVAASGLDKDYAKLYAAAVVLTQRLVELAFAVKSYK